MLRSILPLAMLVCAAHTFAADGNRLTYLDSADPYYPSRTFPKLTTPQWVGEPGVEAVVVLAIDDMREPAKYETYLRPILQRLKQIDGRAPVSIMTCSVRPDDPQLQTWLDEGLSLEIHTLDHPCPLLSNGDFAKAKATYAGCVDLLNQVPRNTPVAFRMPCCDSLNTVSPRAFAEIFNKTTPAGKHLAIDSSVFNVMTADDPELPRETVLDSAGKERFRKYVPFERSFVNTIENYPYPYVIGELCWQFPCAVPSDWEAQNLHKPNNPITVDDWKALIDATVVKQGVMNLVFHPHGWIRNEQVVEMISHAATKHGGKVKFLTFRECLERINRHLLAGHAIRAADGQDNGVRMLDVNADGYQDVVISNEQVQLTRIWQPKEKHWTETPFPTRIVANNKSAGVHFGILGATGHATAFVSDETDRGGWSFNGERWIASEAMLNGLEINGEPVFTARDGVDRGVRPRDLDRDGICEILVSNESQAAVFRWDRAKFAWQRLPFKFPDAAHIVRKSGADAGLRFIDVNEDGHDDVLFSDEKSYLLSLFTDMNSGWSQTVVSGQRPEQNAIPMIVRGETNNGAWVHSRHLWVQNEDTDKLPNLVDRRSFRELLGTSSREQPAQ